MSPSHTKPAPHSQAPDAVCVVPIGHEQTPAEFRASRPKQGGGTEADWQFNEFGLQTQTVRDAPTDVTEDEERPASPKAVIWVGNQVIPENWIEFWLIRLPACQESVLSLSVSIPTPLLVVPNPDPLIPRFS